MFQILDLQYIFISSGVTLEASFEFDTMQTLWTYPKSMNQNHWEWAPGICISLDALGDSYAR